MNQTWLLMLLVSGVVTLALGYLGFSMRGLRKDVRDFSQAFGEFQIKYEKEQGQKMTFSACGEMQHKCAADIKERIDSACHIAKHHKHSETGLVILP